jgi:hypothetical protein
MCGNSIVRRLVNSEQCVCINSVTHVQCIDMNHHLHINNTHTHTHTHRDLIMGFGHRVYKVCDPRSDIIKGFSRRLSESPRYVYVCRCRCVGACLIYVHSSITITTPYHTQRQA